MSPEYILLDGIYGRALSRSERVQVRSCVCWNERGGAAELEVFVSLAAFNDPQREFVVSIVVLPTIEVR